MLPGSWKVRAALAAAMLAVVGYTPHLFGQSTGGTIGPPGGGGSGGGSIGGGGGGTNLRPSIASIKAVQVAGRKFRISGRVSDDTPGNCGVVVTGAANGVVMCDQTGNFDGIFDVPTLGQAQAVAGDGLLESEPVGLTLANVPPSIANFIATHGTGNTWTFSGTVTDEAPGALTVRLAGPTGVNGSNGTVGQNGVFSITVTLAPGTMGLATATVTDWYSATGSASTFFGP